MKDAGNVQSKPGTKIKLSPFVKKVKGKKNWVLMDLFDSRLFHLTPTDNLEELKLQLVKAGLAFETEGVIPLQYEYNIEEYRETVKLRRLMLRITGECDRACTECGNLCRCFKTGQRISEKILQAIIRQFEYIPIDEIMVTGGNPLLEREILEQIRSRIHADKYTIMFRGNFSRQEQELVEKLRYRAKEFPLVEDINLEVMTVEPLDYHFRQFFNPCWGKMLAIDVDGTIKLCLWDRESFGNIDDQNVKEKILRGEFDKYWTLGKDEINECRECEFRYACADCRVRAKREGHSDRGKTRGCKYNPAAGEAPGGWTQ